MSTQYQEYTIENQVLQLVLNQEENGEIISTLLKLYFLVKAENVEGLTEFVEAYLKESDVLARLEALENGETGLLTDNPHEMDFHTLGNVTVYRGNYDAENQRITC